jgi:hypothetical protein
VDLPRVGGRIGNAWNAVVIPHVNRSRDAIGDKLSRSFGLCRSVTKSVIRSVFASHMGRVPSAAFGWLALGTDPAAIFGGMPPDLTTRASPRFSLVTWLDYGRCLSRRHSVLICSTGVGHAVFRQQTVFLERATGIDPATTCVGSCSPAMQIRLVDAREPTRSRPTEVVGNNLEFADA